MIAQTSDLSSNLSSSVTEVQPEEDDNLKHELLNKIPVSTEIIQVDDAIPKELKTLQIRNSHCTKTIHQQRTEKVKTANSSSKMSVKNEQKGSVATKIPQASCTTIEEAKNVQIVDSKPTLPKNYINDKTSDKMMSKSEPSMEKNLIEEAKDKKVVIDLQSGEHTSDGDDTKKISKSSESCETAKLTAAPTMKFTEVDAKGNHYDKKEFSLDNLDQKEVRVEESEKKLVEGSVSLPAKKVKQKVVNMVVKEMVNKRLRCTLNTQCPNPKNVKISFSQNSEKTTSKLNLDKSNINENPHDYEFDSKSEERQNRITRSVSKAKCKNFSSSSYEKSSPRRATKCDKNISANKTQSKLSKFELISKDGKVSARECIPNNQCSKSLLKHDSIYNYNSENEINWKNRGKQESYSKLNNTILTGQKSNGLFNQEKLGNHMPLMILLIYQLLLMKSLPFSAHVKVKIVMDFMIYNILLYLE
ncbi:hypothetical protein CEXT_328311 [Caerostris extrusa]|uniref:Uncharacterized protein n=1 Tax=Caerostris extrusa TaxID=172846 RepID=A0AAV4XVR5_CAEEX|nr:hypothetical protein CEXT_328311 [Caerostris extrusa]